MNLTQLPQHIVQNIVTRVVADSTLPEGLQLRLISKQFDREVQHTIFERDEKDLIAYVRRRLLNVPQQVAFRCFRGFLLRRNHVDRQQRLWRRLDAAISILKEKRPDECAVVTEQAPQPSPDRFMNLASAPGSTDDVERAIAMLCDALFVLFGHDLDPMCLLIPEWYQSTEYWDVLKDKTADFWVMAVAARRNDLQLCQSGIASLKQNTIITDQVRAQNFVDSLRLPAHHGHQEMLKLLLDQEEVRMHDVKRRIHPDMRTTLELAIEEGHEPVVRTLLSRGWDLLEIPGHYAEALDVCVKYKGEPSKRKALLAILLDLTNEWQSEAIMAGMLNALCKNGDLDTVKMVVDRYQATEQDKAAFQWGWHADLAAASILSAAVMSRQAPLVEYVLELKEVLPSILESSFVEQEFLSCKKQAISRNQAEILTKLINHTDQSSWATKILFAYAAITSDDKCLDILAGSVDLDARLDDETAAWSDYPGDVHLMDKMFNISSFHTTLLSIPGVLTFGAFCLIIALKAYNVDTVRFFLDNKVRIGRRYVEITRNLQSRHAAILGTSDVVLPGKGTIMSFTPVMRGPLSCRKMLNQGARITRRSLIVTRRQREVDVDDENTTQTCESPSKRQRWLNRIKFLHLGNSKSLRKQDVRIVLGIEVPYTRYHSFNPNGDNDGNGGDDPDDFLTDEYEEETNRRFREMQDLLYKHRQPYIYADLKL